MHRPIPLLPLALVSFFSLCACSPSTEDNTSTASEIQVVQIEPIEAKEDDIKSADDIVTEVEIVEPSGTSRNETGENTAQESQPDQNSSESTGIHPCPDCNGEGCIGTCSNCGGDGWDAEAQQICVKCLHTGKNKCERCDGYGMLDSNGNGVGTNTTPVQPTPTIPNALDGTTIEPATCWICLGDGLCNNCDGTGRYAFNPEWAGDRCRTCDGTGRCASCNGRGVIG